MDMKSLAGLQKTITLEKSPGFRDELAEEGSGDGKIEEKKHRPTHRMFG